MTLAARRRNAMRAILLDRSLDDIPGITTEVRRVEENTQQTQTPVEEQVTPEPASTER
jgi:hypothetical protein